MKKVVIFSLFLLFVGLVSANVDVQYSLIGDKAFVEIDFGAVVNFEYRLPLDARTIEVNSEYEVIEFEDHKLLKVIRSKDLKISYITNSVHDRSSNHNYFILINEFDGPFNLSLTLPEGAILEDLIFPDYDSLATDGKNIILNWKNFNSEEAVISYKILMDSNSFWFYFLILLIIIFSIFYVYQAKRLKRKLIKIKAKTKRSKNSKIKDLTKNLFGEEKKIIEYLFNKKRHASWTKEIVRDLGISKVRLSRRLRNLKQKGLIEKIPHGNENRIRLLKTH